jgi:hypothetical protein
MRWTRRRRKTSDAAADGQAVWFRSPDAGIKLAKDDSAGDGGYKPGHQEERGAAVNTIAQGMSMFRLSCSDYACVLFNIAHKAAGAVKHPAFPAPSDFWGGLRS